MRIIQFLNANADAIQTLLALAASLVAGVWWITRRDRLPRALVDVHVEQVPLDDHSRLLSVTVNISNTGHVLIRVANLRLFVHQIVPTGHVLRDGLPVPFDFSRGKDCDEFDWPALVSHERRYRPDLCPTFEPGESGPITFEFRQDTIPEVVRVYVHIRNEAKWSWWRKMLRRKEVGWVASKIVRFDHETKLTNPA